MASTGLVTRLMAIDPRVDPAWLGWACTDEEALVTVVAFCSSLSASDLDPAMGSSLLLGKSGGVVIIASCCADGETLMMVVGIFRYS